MRVDPFEIAVPQHDVDDLRVRLRSARLPDQLDDAGWSWGADIDYIKRATSYWADGFDWRAQEARLNSLPQFKARLSRGDVHFVHVKGAGARTMPLLLSHGWPGSFAEMTPMIPLLTAKNALTDRLGLTFDLVVPSLPGFGFSSRPTREGASPATVAEMFHELMVGLGYETFGVQGGDLGAGISMRLALQYPLSVIGVHTNFPSFGFDGSESTGGRDGDGTFGERKAEWLKQEGGYSHMHATRPQTVGYALNDSPAGLAAWMLEKFHAWSDRAGSESMPFDLDELLTNVSIYWFTETITSSMRIYRESAGDPLILSAGNRIDVPYGVAAFPFELPIQSREIVERVTNLTRWTDMPAGGHFAAMEEPDRLAAEVLTFFDDILRAVAIT